VFVSALTLKQFLAFMAYLEKIERNGKTYYYVTKNFRVSEKKWKKIHPVELGAILHNKLVQIHPFADGNGKTSRVVMNWILMKNKLPMFYIELRDKIKYYEVVEEGDRGNDKAIVNYVAKVRMEQHTFKSKED
jgi:fido (protein-threonine AMPylation protein)